MGILKGAFIFTADLSREISKYMPTKTEFLAVSSYGDGTTSGAVRIVMDLRKDIAGKHVLIVEDIVDSGKTLNYLRNMLESRKPASINIAAFLVCRAHLFGVFYY